MSHQPDRPFDCPVTWGPVVHVWGTDMRLHVCNRPPRHDGDCQCKCGDERDGA